MTEIIYVTLNHVMVVVVLAYYRFSVSAVMILTSRRYYK